MKNPTSVVALMAGFALIGTVTARAQTPSQTDSIGFVNISAGAQTQSRLFSDTATFSLFNETARVVANQSVNGGFVFDASAGYRVWQRLSVALGVSTFNVSGDAALAASIPNAQSPGRPTSFTATATGLKQNDVAVNLQFVWTVPMTDQIDLSIFLGPSIVHVSQDLATATATSGVSGAAVVTESATTPKAGTAGIDLRYKVTDRAGVGVFARYAGGEVNLSSVRKLKVGGIQVGGGLRWRF